MCLLIAQPKGVTFKKKEIVDFLDFNADGFGACFARNGKLEIVRIVGDANAVIASYYSTFAGKKAMLHFRMATHGTTGLENCHPFLLTPDIACAHNGILNITADAKTGASDTRLFCEHVLAPIARDNPDALFTPQMRNILSDMIGDSNRLMFMRADGAISIVNEHEGMTHRKAWMSNNYAWSSPARYDWRKWAGIPGANTEDDYRAFEMRTGRNVIHTRLDPEAAQDALLAHRDIASAEDGAEDGAEDDDGHVRPDNEDTDWCEGLDMTLEDVASAWHGYGSVGVKEWLANNPEDAALLISTWYKNVTEPQAIALIVGNQDRAIEWLIDIVTDDIK